MLYRSPRTRVAMHRLLSDPTVTDAVEGADTAAATAAAAAAVEGDACEGTEADDDVRRHVRQAMIALVGALFSFGVLAFLVYEDFDPSCDFETHSALPFNLITQASGRYRYLMLLTGLSVAAALSYPLSVARKARPVFVHVAGCYLVANSLMLCSMVATVWAGCYNGVAYVRISTAYFSIVGFIVSFCLMQYSILLKAEALNVDATEEEKQRSGLRNAFKAVFNPLSMTFGLVSALVPLGVVERGPTWTWTVVVLTQAALMITFCFLLLIFTVMAIREMRKCHVALAQSGLEGDELRYLKNLLAGHMLATLFANFTTLCLFMSVAGVILMLLPPSFMLVAFVLDNTSSPRCCRELLTLDSSQAERTTPTASCLSRTS
eukprot:TRINITY_DN2832_c0_g2_i3.p1 TRINITY_DN2832_c0_g2~~TRINITY_DN2832_c0_g2_i3.p1  ORF type:complete len:377 (+),score=55.85 TRINITY_DN2832_c0_g2_i3:445-1575(+)